VTDAFGLFFGKQHGTPRSFGEMASEKRQSSSLSITRIASSKTNDDGTAHLDQMDSNDPDFDDNDDPSSKSHHDFDDNDDAPSTLVPGSIFRGGNGDDSSDNIDDKAILNSLFPRSQKTSMTISQT
jgi:hypothetical protein